MRLGINTRFLLHNRLEGIGWFTYETVRRMAQAHPNVEFVCFFDRPYHEEFVFSDNIIPKVVPPPARHPWLWQLWFQFALPRAIRRSGCDAFISPDGFLPLKLKIPSVLVIHDLAFEAFPEHVPKSARRFYQRETPKYAAAADRIVTVSEATRADLVHYYGLDANKVSVAWNGVSDVYTSLGQSDRERARQRWSDGKPYFLFVSALQPRKNVLGLLQAYQVFRERTPSSEAKLILCGSHTWQKAEIDAAWNAHPYHEDISFTGHVSRDELNQLLSGSIALVYVSLYEGFGIPLVEAMQAGTAVLCSNVSAMPEVVGDAGLLVDPHDPNSIAAGMQRLVSEEGLRGQLVELGHERKKLFSWDHTANQLWQAVSNVMDPSAASGDHRQDHKAPLGSETQSDR